MYQQIRLYFTANNASFLSAVWEHIAISAVALAVAILIAIPLGCLCVWHKDMKKATLAIFQTLRIIPSLAILLLLLPVMGTGFKPAVTALVLLAIPPILLNVIAGLNGVPEFMLDTAAGLGMSNSQVWRKVRFPLAMPLILNGTKIAVVEIIASATLAAKIGAGGLGEIIFTGLGLARTDLLVIGGISVAVLSLAGVLVFTILGKVLFPFISP